MEWGHGQKVGMAAQHHQSSSLSVLCVGMPINTVFLFFFFKYSAVFKFKSPKCRPSFHM